MSPLDPAYQETDGASAHYAHWIQPLEQGAWWCLSCWGPRDRDEEEEA